jgi:hypothetical protein
MTDYVRAYDNPTNIYYREARQLADRLRTDTNLTVRGINAGVLRWKSNGAVVPADCARLAHAIGIRVSIDSCDRVRDAELSRTLARYRRANRDRQPSNEERAEARAAFGPDAKIVNIFTGREFTT